MTLRVLIAVTHLLGAGHIVRASAIGRALVRRGHTVTLVSGGTPSSLADTASLDLVQLPPLRCRVGDFSRLLDADLVAIGPAYLEERRRTLVSAFARTRPDVVLTEHFPFGRRSLAGEFQSLLDAAEAARPRPLVLASVRDILVAPTKADRIERTHALVARRYGGVLVHGEESLVPLEHSWPVDHSLRAKLIYTGYVGPETSPFPVPSDGSILVSGGSSAASLPLYRTAVAAAGKCATSGTTRPWRVLVGRGVDEIDFAELAAAAPPHVLIERARADFHALLARAAVFVGQAGYNTVMDIAATRARAVLVPFEEGRETEQRLRAEGLAGRGLASLLPETALSPSNLLDAIGEAERRERPAFSIPLDGQGRAARIIERLAAGRHDMTDGASQ